METANLNLNTGERAIDNAPKLTLRNGRSCIPQHYLQYAHSRHSVETIISNIEFCDRYPIFVSEDSGGLILQIGIIGYDNYKAAEKQSCPKIVFGRKWRVEPNLPTSEIIQTAFLAIKKAREHEIRELFTLSTHGKTATPFNNHHDLPLMARNADILQTSAPLNICLKQALSAIKFDGGIFDIADKETLRNGMTVLTLNFLPKSVGSHTEFSQEPIVLLLKDTTANDLHHALITEMIARSDRLVDETFRYKGFARFSRDHDAAAIAQLSTDLRQKPETLLGEAGKAESFTQDFAAERYDTDLTRIPQLTRSPYSQKLHDHLSAMKLSNFDMLLKAQERA